MGTADSKPNQGGRISGSASRPQLRLGASDAEMPGANMGSVPLYVDSRSVLYSDSFLVEQNLNDNRVGVSESQPETSFDIGVPEIPLSSSCFVTLDQALPTAGFIATPQYNAEGNETAEEMLFHSPVLRSYHDQSFPGGVGTPRVSPPGSHPGGAAGTTGASTSTSLRHNRFLEIAGSPIGLENYGNTCYANSVVQLIYHCAPLRLRLLELFDAYKARKGSHGFEETTVLFAFCQLIYNMHKANNARKKEDIRKVIHPRDFLRKVGEKNPFFRNEQQDAHEFCMFLLNDIMESEKKIMEHPKNARYFREESKGGFSLFSSKSKTASSSSSSKRSPAHLGSDHAAAAEGGESVPLPLQTILQGKFASLTACLNCECITCKKEAFLDLSLETRQGCSLLDCLTHYGDPSLFLGSNQLRCETCKKSVNAANTMHVEELPQFALLIHLKRFRYDPEKQNFSKTAHHVALPMTMDVEEYSVEEQRGVVPKEGTSSSQKTKTSDENATGSTAAPKDSFSGLKPHIRQKLRGVAQHKARFELTGFVAHVGEGPNVGHYFTCTRYGPNLWRRFDDDVVSTMSNKEVQQLFGVPIEASGTVTTTAYILLYERVA